MCIYMTGIKYNYPQIVGNFGVVWSGRLRIGISKEVEVAIKKMKCTY